MLINCLLADDFDRTARGQWHSDRCSETSLSPGYDQSCSVSRVCYPGLTAADGCGIPSFHGLIPPLDVLSRVVNHHEGPIYLTSGHSARLSSYELVCWFANDGDVLCHLFVHYIRLNWANQSPGHE